MSTSKKGKDFGQKGINDRAVSLADSLLSGRPLGRARKRDTVPKLKPRPKPVFGRRAPADVFDGAGRQRMPWAVGLAVGCICMAVVVRYIVAS